MTKEEVQKLSHGLYELFWDEGGSSLASVGSNEKGDCWFSATNWVSGPSYDWKKVTSIRLITAPARPTEGAARKSCGVYKISDAIKGRFTDAEDHVPAVEVVIEDEGRICWCFQTYCLDQKDVRVLVDLANEFGLDMTIGPNSTGLRVRLSMKTEVAELGVQKIDLGGVHAK